MSLTNPARSISMKLPSFFSLHNYHPHQQYLLLIILTTLILSSTAVSQSLQEGEEEQRLPIPDPTPAFESYSAMSSKPSAVPRPEKLTGGCACKAIRYTIKLTPDIEWPVTGVSGIFLISFFPVQYALLVHACVFLSGLLASPVICTGTSLWMSARSTDCHHKASPSKYTSLPAPDSPSLPNLQIIQICVYKLVAG